MIEDNRNLSREWFETVWNQRNVAAIERLAAPQALSFGLSEDGLPVRGLDHFKKFHNSLLNAFPDLLMTVEDVLAEGDKTVVRISFLGTHTGPGIGIEPTGRRVRSSGLVMFRWAGGQIVEAWNEFDAAGMMRQLQAPATLRA